MADLLRTLEAMARLLLPGQIVAMTVTWTASPISRLTTCASTVSGLLVLQNAGQLALAERCRSFSRARASIWRTRSRLICNA
jgi:hypothetical protein